MVVYKQYDWEYGTGTGNMDKVSDRTCPALGQWVTEPVPIDEDHKKTKTSFFLLVICASRAQ